MNRFEENQHPRQSTGKFAEKPQSGAEVRLGGLDPAIMERLANHWTPENEQRAREVILKMDGVSDVKFNEGVVIDADRASGKTGTVTYKGKEYPIVVSEAVGSVSGTGTVQVVGSDARAFYNIPKTSGGRAYFYNQGTKLGEEIESEAARTRLKDSLRAINPDIYAHRISTTGGRIGVALVGRNVMDGDLTYYGGQKWSGYGGIAYGTKPEQRAKIVQSLGGSSISANKAKFRQIRELLAQAQTEHEKEFPPTPAQLKLRRRLSL